jgi:predicted RNase H-like nuclease (RuvC/YqgF family)
MAFTTYEFPYTRTYDGDLGFLIKQYNELIAEYKSLAADIEYVKEFAKTLDERVAAAIKVAMDKFTAQVNATLAKYDARITATESRVDEFQTILDRFAKELYEMRKLILALEDELRQYTDFKCEVTFQRCKRLIDNWAKELPPVIDPTDGKVENINVALQHMYNFSTSGITALEFDGLFITARMFDNKNITAKELDTKGKEILTTDGKLYMLSPFTGAMDLIENVVNSLAALHMRGITAVAIDDKALTAEAFDAMQITAYNFDWANPIV